MKTRAEFWSAVDMRDPAECWEWKRGRFSYGYGQVYWDKRRQNASRVAYEIVGKSPRDPQVVRHLCHNPGCCNPLHLAGGTHADNDADSRRCGRKKNLTGADHWNCKLTDEQVEEIRKDPRKYAAIAVAYGVSPNHVSNIKNGVRRALP